MATLFRIFILNHIHKFELYYKQYRSSWNFPSEHNFYIIMDLPQSLHFKISLIIGILLILFAPGHAQNNNDLVYLKDGKLVYTPYANQGQTNAVNQIPDFSFAGYKQGGVALPEVPVAKVIFPLAEDNTASIQNAIDYVERLPLDSHGFRGAVLLKAGTYPLDGQLFIKASGVVLRGEGQGKSGTVLHANKAVKHSFINLGNPSVSPLVENRSTTQRITSSYVPVGTKRFDVNDASLFAIGDLISVKKTVNQKWIDDLGMGQSELCGSKVKCFGWTPEEYSLSYEREIKAISGNEITINIAIVDAMETQYGGGEISKASVSGRINNSGVENLRIESAYANDEDEKHVWKAIELKNVENCWVKKVTAQFMGYSAVSLTNSNFNTIEECAAIDFKSILMGGRRYGFNIEGSSLGNLFQRCYTNEGRHDFVTGAMVTGPNVFLDSYANNTHADIGPHHRWSTGVLFDNIRGGEMRVRNRGNSGSGHGWSGAQTMFWNVKSYQKEIKIESPPGARNWGIGNEGLKQTGDGYWQDWRTPVSPRSLYLQQLQDRLGTQAVDFITVEAQRTGPIYDLLAAWAGEGELMTAKAND